MPDNETPPLPKVDDLLRQAKAVNADLAAADSSRRDGIGALAAVIDQQRDTIRSLTLQAEQDEERHREEMSTLERRVVAAEASKSEAIKLAEKAVNRANEAERRMAEMTEAFDSLVTSVTDRNRSLLEEDRSIEAIIARSGVDIAAGAVDDARSAPEVDRFATRRPHPAADKPASFPYPLPPAAPRPIIAAVDNEPALPVADEAPVSPSAQAVTVVADNDSEDVFAEPAAAESLSAEERKEEERSFTGLMTSFKGLLKPRASAIQTQQA